MGGALEAPRLHCVQHKDHCAFEVLKARLEQTCRQCIQAPKWHQALDYSCHFQDIEPDWAPHWDFADAQAHQLLNAE